MSKKNSLEQYTLFYEKIGASKGSQRQLSELKNENSYDKSPALSEAQVKALSEDLQASYNQKPRQG